MIFFILLDSVSGPSLLAAPSSCCSAFFARCQKCPWKPALYWRQVGEAASGSLVLLLSLSPTQDPGCATQGSSSPTHRVTLPWQRVFWAEREALLMGNGKRWDEKRGVCFTCPNCLNRKVVQRGPRCGAGNQREPSNGVGRTQMVENRTLKWHSRKLLILKKSEKFCSSWREAFSGAVGRAFYQFSGNVKTPDFCCSDFFFNYRVKNIVSELISSCVWHKHILLWNLAECRQNFLQDDQWF